MFVHCCKSAVWETAPFIIKPTVDDVLAVIISPPDLDTLPVKRLFTVVENEASLFIAAANSFNVSRVEGAAFIRLFISDVS